LPTLTTVNGVKIECFSGDHPPPHIHASYSGYEDLIVIDTAEIYVGDMPNKKRKIAQEYVKNNTQTLMAIFNSLNPPIKRNEKE